MFKLILSVCVFLVVVGCSSVGKDGEKRTFTKDYNVIDAQYDRYPGWINEPLAWAEENDKEYDKHRYFVSTSEVISNKRLCSKSSEAQAVAQVAGELTQFIKNSYAQSVQGNADDDVESYMEDTLAQEIQSFIVGASIFRSYWEKRQYLTELGAQEKKVGYVCSALIKMKKETLADAIKRAEKKLMDSSANPESKAKVQEAINKAQAEFAKLN